MEPYPKIRIRNLNDDISASIESLKADRSRIRASRAIVDKALKDGKTYYSINTGFGILSNKRVSESELKKLQYNLLISHAVGVGELIPKDISRLMLALKIHSLGLGPPVIRMAASTISTVLFCTACRMVANAATNTIWNSDVPTTTLVGILSR